MISAAAVTHAADRVLVLKPMEGKDAKSSGGIIDPNLFKDGETSNRLHAVMDGETCLWTLKYERGALPPVLRDQTFTSFKNAKKYAEEYFKQRNVAITEVITL